MRVERVMEAMDENLASWRPWTTNLGLEKGRHPAGLLRQWAARLHKHFFGTKVSHCPWPAVPATGPHHGPAR